MKLFKSKIEQYILSIFLIAAILLSFIFYTLTNIDENNNSLIKLENNLTLTKNLLEEQKRYALSLAILLSEDKEIINSFLKKDRRKSFEIVNRKIELLKKMQDSKIDVQIHNKDLTTYLRSWDFTKKDIPLKSFRQGIVKVHEDKKPLVSIELGKRLNIKAISPIIIDQKIIGSLETIIDFEYLSKQIKQKGFELYVLLDNRFLDIANVIKNNAKKDNFTLVNNTNIANLSKIDLDDLKEYGYISNDKMVFSYFSYYDFKHNKLGYILTGMKNENSFNQNNSFSYSQYKKENIGVVVE